MPSYQKAVTFLFLTPLLILCSYASAYDLVPSDADSLHWHQATVIGGFVGPLQDNGVRWNLESPHGKLPVSFWKSKGPSRGLYLVLPGTGGDATSKGSNYLGEAIASNNYDVLILANPFSSAFQSTFSKDRFIGFPNKDIYDLMAMLEAGMSLYKSKYGMPKSVALIGSSLGGTYAIMMANRSVSFKINKFIALNPPVDFDYAINQLDVAIRARIRLGLSNIPSVLLNKVLPLFRLTSAGISAPVLGRLTNTLGDDEELNQALIGGSFQIELVKIARGLRGTNVYDTRDKELTMTRNLTSMTFSRYLGYAGMGINRQYTGNASFAHLLTKLDLREILRKTENKKNVYLIHSQDDFLLQPNDLGDLDRILGDHLTVFRSGGHCGIDWTPSFHRALNKTIQR